VILQEEVTMDDQELLKRIELNPEVLVGKPIVRETRLSVQYIVGLLAHGATVEEILQDHPRLAREDIQACLLFAAETVGDNTFVPLTTGTV
jgi:uncharacterized protein (DUF433 family)/predicted nuclease of predicted toxin-antitoxin system